MLRPDIKDTVSTPNSNVHKSKVRIAVQRGKTGEYNDVQHRNTFDFPHIFARIPGRNEHGRHKRDIDDKRRMTNANVDWFKAETEAKKGETTGTL